MFGGFSWKRALGISKMKSKIAKATGIPTTKQGRRLKAQRMGFGAVLAGETQKPSRKEKTKTASGGRGLLQTACPHCNQTRNFRPESKGNVVRCEACGEKFSLPTEAARAEGSWKEALGGFLVLAAIAGFVYWMFFS